MNNKKLIISILVVLILPVGYMLSSYFLGKYKEESKQAIRDSFTQLSTSIQKIQKEIETNIEKSSQNIHLIASLNLIVNYENSENYDKALFNGEKKRVIALLENQTDKQAVDYLAIYDTTNRLVTLINNSQNQKSLTFSAYEDFQRVYFVKNLNEELYTQRELSLETESIIKELSLFTSDYSNKKESVYQTDNEILRIKSKVPLIRERVGNTAEIVGYIIALKEYTESDLSKLILPKMALSYSLEPKKRIGQSLKFTGTGYSMPKLFSTQALSKLLIQEQNDKFFSRVEFPLKDVKLLIKIEAP